MCVLKCHHRSTVLLVKTTAVPRIRLSQCVSSALTVCIVKRRIRLSPCAVPAMFSSPHCCPTYLRFTWNLFMCFFFMCFFSFLILQRVSPLYISQSQRKLDQIWQIPRSSSSPSPGGWTAAFRNALTGHSTHHQIVHWFKTNPNLPGKVHKLHFCALAVIAMTLKFPLGPIWLHDRL